MAKTEKQKPINVMRSIKMPFNDAEGSQMGHQIAFMTQECDAIKEEAKSNADAFKQQVTAKETSIKALVRSMNLGYQMIQKSCEFKKNFESGKREYWFDGKIVDEEPLTAADHQIDLELAEKSEMAVKTNEVSETNEVSNEEIKKDDDDLKPVELTEELKNQRDEFIKLGDQAMKKKKYADGHKYYKAAQKIDPSNEELAGKIERTESFLKLIANAEEERTKPKEEVPIHNENNPLHETQTLKDCMEFVCSGNEAFKKKKFQEAEIQYSKAFNLAPDNEEIKTKLAETKEKVDRLIDAKVIAPREEW